MSEKLNYTKAFAKALADHLRGNVSSFTDYKTGDGGCETCGYGAEEYEVLDMDALEAEIDKFTETFKKKSEQ